MERTLEEIDSLRTRLGVAQKEMCDRAEVSQSTLVRNRQLNREPSKRIRRRLAAALDAIAEERGIRLVEERTRS